MHTDAKGALATAVEALALIQDDVGIEHQPRLHFVAGHSLIVTDRGDLAIAHLVQGAELARRHGLLDVEFDCTRYHAIALLILDDLDESLLRFGAALTLATQLGDPVRERRVLDNLLSVRTQLGEPLESLLPLRVASVVSEHHTAESRVSALNNLGRSYMRLGRPQDAIVHLRQASQLARQSGMLAAQMLPIQGTLGVALAMIHEASEALQVLDGAHKTSLAAGFDRENTQLLAYRGEALRHLGLFDESVACLRQCQQAVSRTGRLADERLVCEELLLSLKAAGDSSGALEASEALREIDLRLGRDRAARRLSALTARFELDKTRREAELQALHNAELQQANEQLRTANASLKKALQALGFDTRQTRRPGVAGDTALTAREVQVLSLLGKGKSNRAIGEALGLSPITVRHHVTAIMGKLGASSRTEAVALALRNGML